MSRTESLDSRGAYAGGSSTGTPAMHDDDGSRGDDRFSGSTEVSAPGSSEQMDDGTLLSRRQKFRRSGGFILDSMLPSARRRTNKLLDAERPGHRSKRRLDLEINDRPRKENGDGSRVRSEHHKSLLPQHAAQPTFDGQENRDESMESSNVANNENANASASISFGSDTHDHAAPTVAAIDPTQIVNMALNLSESRRRNFSSGQYPIVPNRRAVSAAIPAVSSPNFSSSYTAATGGSLRQHLQAQRRVSRNVSPSNRSAPSPRYASRSGSTYLDPTQSFDYSKTVEYKFSPSTIARAQKAREYIELFYEYRRLLQYLPPLKPNYTAPGNTIVSATSIAGTSNVQLSRVPSYANKKHELGRPYNALQTIRNRKTRARERRPLAIDVAEFENIDRVRKWVDLIARQAYNSEYRAEDSVLLPDFPSADDFGKASVTISDLPAQKDLPSRPAAQNSKGRRMDYVFSPAELFADAHWMEQGDNKLLIEKHSGNKVFPSYGSPGFAPPRLSREEPREPETKIDSIAGSATGPITSDSHTADDSDVASEQGRKRRLFRSHRHEKPATSKKHGWRVTRGRSPSASSLSSSDEDAPNKPKAQRVTSHGENTGPLARHLQDMVEKEVGSQIAISPPLDSPDHWGMGAVGSPGAIVGSGKVSQLDVDLNGFMKERNGRPLSRQEQSSKPPTRPTYLHGEPRSSFESTSTTPNSPIVGRELTGIGSEHSPPPSWRRHKKSKLSIFRSDASVKSQHTDGDESAADDRKPRQTTAELNYLEEGKGKPIVRHLLPHRRNDSRHSTIGRTDSEHRKEQRDMKDPKEPASAVTRFFKGGRIGELVRNEGAKVGEFIFKKDPPAGEAASSGSDDSGSSDSENDGMLSRFKRRPTPLNRSTTAESISTVTSGHAHNYHLNLPTFRSTNGAADGAQASEQDALYSQQPLKQDRGRSRFERLAPPRMNLTGISSRDPSPVEGPAEYNYDTSRRSSLDPNERLSDILDHPGSMPGRGLPPSGLSKFSNSPTSRRNQSRPSLAGKRQWSISDKDRCASEAFNEKAILPYEIARIRTLLLCSAIKARELHMRAHTIRDEPPAFLQRAAEAANVTLIAVPKKEEHVLAARIIATDLEQATSAVRSSLAAFHAETCTSLVSQISSLRSLLDDDLTPRVRVSADAADAFTRELTEGIPLRVKKVYDRAGMLTRRRRKKLRWVRRGGWALLEWALKVIFWWVWLVVVLFKTVKGVVFGVGKGIKWVFWL